MFTGYRTGGAFLKGFFLIRANDSHGPADFGARIGQGQDLAPAIKKVFTR
jgi:hypothetical protein